MYSEKEIVSQKARIQGVKDDPEKDEHDVKKQEEVLAEYVNAVPDEQSRLFGFYEALKEAVEISAESEDLVSTDEYTKAQAALAAAEPVLAACGKLDDD